jgi:hypothetical protein
VAAFDSQDVRPVVWGSRRRALGGCIVPILERNAFQAFMNNLDRDRRRDSFVDESVEGYHLA